MMKIYFSSDFTKLHKTKNIPMGSCLCGEEFEARNSRFRPVPFPNGGRDHQNPNFHSPQFQQFAQDPQHQNSYYYHQQQQQKDPKLSGEGTRMTFGSPNASGSSMKRDPSQIPGPRPETNYNGFAPIDMNKTVVYRQGNEQQSAILKTPRGNTGRVGGTPKAGARVGGGGTPRVSSSKHHLQNSNDPYGSEDPHHQTQNDYDDDDGDEGEMILICADCYADVMDERCPRQCPVSGKMHV
jgi:hypothetical protein